MIELEKGLQKYLILVEFTSSFGESPAEHRKKIAEKRQVYQGVLQHFHCQRPGTIVMQQTYVMSCHGVIMAQDWSDSLAFWGLTDKEIRQTK
eukprot:1064490-Rhodomonas_salina.1